MFNSKYVSLNQTFNEILDYIEDRYLLSDILQMPSTDNKTILFREFKKKYSSAFSGDQQARHELLTELDYRVEEVKRTINEEGRKRFKSTYVIHSIQEYIEVLEEVRKAECGRELWFRGQLDQKFHLVPNVMRYAKEVASDYGRAFKPKEVSWFSRGQQVIYPNVRRMLDELKNNGEKIVKFEIENEFEWMFLAQHYGMLTPLLDWTEDPLVALFFAMDGLSERKQYDINKENQEYEKYGKISEAAAIYILDPAKLNEYSRFVYKDKDGKQKSLDYPVKINNSNSSIFQGYIDGGEITPLCIKASRKEYRICRQSGNFVCQGSNVQPIDSLAVSKEVLYKIYVPYANISDIKKELNVLNITKESIYGERTELDECAQKIRSKEEQAFSKLINSINEKFKDIDV